MKKTDICSRVRRTLRSQAGLTLVELLVTVVLVSIVGGVVVVTVDLATKSLGKRSQESDAQLLCSALSVFMQDELTYAGKVESYGDTVKFTDNARGLGSGCSFTTDDNGHLVMISAKGNYDPVGAGDYGGDAAHKKLRAEQDVTIEDDLLKIHIVVSDANTGSEIAENTFRVRPVAPGANVK